MEAAIDTKLAAKLGLSEGDALTLYNRSGEPWDFTVKSIVSAREGIFLFNNRIVITESSLRTMENGADMGVRMIYIDILDNSRIIEAKEIPEKNAPAAEVELLSGGEAEQQIIEYITNAFLVMFAVLLLLVLFVTISSSQRIITDKMPVIGTFKSLGISSRLTYTVLLAENALYGLVGSVPGVLLDSAVRPAMVKYIVAPATSDGKLVDINTGSTSPALMIAVIAGAMLIECLCPIKEILLAVKTPIRDIIFSNKDTQYRHSRVSTATGIILAVIAVILLFVPDSFFALLLCFIFTAVAAAILFPYPLRFISGLIAKLAGRADMPVTQLAATEVRQRKSTVGSAVLCFAASSAAIVICIFASAFGTTFTSDVYNADLLVWVQMDTDAGILSYIDDIDGVTDVEYLYSTMDQVMINGQGTQYQTLWWTASRKAATECTAVLWEYPATSDMTRW